MSDPFVGEIRAFSFNFPPSGWALCNGQLLPVSQNTALFAILGTIYGGNGQSTFALPNLQGCAPLHHGQGMGLSNRDQGETNGVEFVTLTEAQMPAHKHNVIATSQGADQPSPENNVWAQAVSDQGAFNYYQTTGPDAMDDRCFVKAGGGQPHNNMPPYLVVNFCIALQGNFPQP